MIFCAHQFCRCLLHALDAHTSSISHVYVIDPKSVKKDDLYGNFTFILRFFSHRRCRKTRSEHSWMERWFFYCNTSTYFSLYKYVAQTLDCVWWWLGSWLGRKLEFSSWWQQDSYASKRWTNRVIAQCASQFWSSGHRKWYACHCEPLRDGLVCWKYSSRWWLASTSYFQISVISNKLCHVGGLECTDVIVATN